MDEEKKHEVFSLEECLKENARKRLIRAIGILFLGLSGLVMALFTVSLYRDRQELAKESECRFDISAEVERISDQIDVDLGRLFVALSRGEQASIERFSRELSEHSEELVPAIERRDEAVEICEE